MGATNIRVSVLAKTDEEAKKKFEVACEQSRYEDGHSYSGCIGMKYTFKIRKRFDKTFDEEIENFVEEDEMRNDKYDKNAYCVVYNTEDTKKTGKRKYHIYGIVPE